ncbi:MAG: hypothetical protein H6822_00545 [Planctomycetaceae bacterium]|nr:hypothetical protein [Planctomycetales bacterium]MCB9920633.1 hypothetical protein [Planctomycetaceae bacterium]
MTELTPDKLYVQLSASQTRKRLKGHGLGVKRVEAVDRKQCVVVHTATGDHLRELRSLFAGLLQSQSPQMDAEQGEQASG